MSKVLHAALLFLVFSITSASSVFGQECDCIGCPIQITDNGTFQVFLEVNIDGPNDLGQCQLEQVCFTIQHTWVGDLAATLTSPSGLNYIIMGDSNNGPGGCGNSANNIDVCITTGTGNPLTNNTNYICNGGAGTCLVGDWTMPCGGVTDPVTGALQAPGCDLAAFNVPGDPVNGLWTLTVNDICGQDTGPLQDWSLTFSCPTLSCTTCEPEGGSIPSAPITICGANGSLNLPPSGHQTDSDYGYTYLISEGGIVVDVMSSPNLSGFPPGDYEVCGFSYANEAAGQLFDLIGESLSTLQSDFMDDPPPFCADFSNNCVDVSIGEPPFVEIIGEDLVCSNGTTTLELIGGPFGDITWSTGSSSDNINVDPGTYSVTVTDPAGCESETDFTVGAFPDPEPEIIGPDEICEGTEAELELNEDYAAYEWSTGEFTTTIFVDEPGGYEVTVTDDNGCEGYANFTLDFAPPVNVTISGILSFCEGEGTTLTASNGFASYEWSTFETFQDIYVDIPDTYSVTVTNDIGCEGVAEVEVVENPLPEPGITGPDAVCIGETITLTATPGFAGYSWSTSFNTFSTPVDAAGIYTVTVTDANGCEGETDFEVIEGEGVDAFVEGDLFFCPGGSTELTITDGYDTYEWSNNLDGNEQVIDAEGNYTVTVTSVDGCTQILDFYVNELTPPSPGISGDLSICEGEFTTLVVDGVYQTYEWSDGTDNFELIADEAGTYSVTVTDDNGCEGETSVDVVINTPVEIEIAGPASLCNNAFGQISISGSFLSVNWIGGPSNTNIYDIVGPGVYEVEVVDQNGCEAFASIDIPLGEAEPIEIVGDTQICPDGDGQLMASAGYVSYEWSNGQNTQTITVNNPGTYFVTGTDANGCTTTESITLTQYPLPPVAISGRLSFCPAGGTNLTATAGYVSYAWSNNATTNTVFLNQAGTYTVTVTDANGCQNTASATIVEDSELDPVINGVPNFCAGLSTTLTVPDDFSTYMWSNNAQINEISVSTPGTYTVTVADEFGCMGTASVQVTSLPLPTPAISGDLDYCIGDSTTLNGGNGYASYTWSGSGNTNQFLNVTTPGNYGLTVTDGNGCVGTTSTTVIENALPVTSILGEPGYCPGLTTTLSAQPGFVSYQWSTSTSGTSIEVGTTETFSLSVTDANGCVGVATQAVEEYLTAIPAINGAPQFCPGTSTSLSADAGFVNYNWSNGASTPNVTVTQAGTVSLMVTDNNGCVTSNSLDISNFVVTAPMITAPAGFCNGSTATLMATPGYAEYLWSNTAQTADITVSTGGVYELDVVDNNGCPSEAAINIQQYALPTPEIGGSLTFCVGNSTQLNAGATYAAYSWSNGSDQPEITVSTPGNIGLTVTDNRGCIGSTVELVNEATELSPVISGDRDYCIGLSTTLSAGTGFATYEWSTGETTNSITVDEPGTYMLSVTDAGGCAGTAMAVVVENPLPTPQISGDLDFCAGLSTQLSATPGFVNYQWSTGAPTTMVTVNAPGVYSVTVEDSNGCINETDTTVIEQALPVFSIVGPTNFCVDSFTVLNVAPAFAAYDWSVGSDQQSVQVSTGGTVGVTVTDSNGCISSGAQTLATVPLPLADAGNPQDLDCEVLEVNLGGNGSTTGSQFTYQWTGPGITPTNENLLTPTVGEPGIYTLQVTNENFGCLSAPAQVEIEDLAYTPQIVLEVLDILDCATATVQIDARDSDGGPQFIYQWYDEDLNPIPGGNSLLLQVNQAQFYTLSIIDTLTGCDATGMIEVTENELYPVAEAGLAQLITCGEPVVTLNGTGSQMGGQITYNWTTPNGTIVGNNNASIASANQPGWYFLLVTDEQNGCANIDSVFVSQDTALPTAQTSDDFELDCNFPTTSLSGAGSSQGSSYTYQWFLNGNAINDATSLQLTAEAPGTYMLVVTDTENDCTAQDVVEISLNPEQPQALNFITATPTCAGDDDGGIILTGVEGGIPPYTYSVGGAPYGTTTNFNNLVAGNYEVVVEDATGCLLLTTITVPDGNDLTLELGDDQYLTEGELADIYPQISIDSASLVSINWQTTATLPCPECVLQLDLALNESTQFFLDIEDENGCTARDLLTIFVKKDRNIYVPNAFSPDGNGDNDIFYIFSDASVEKIRSFLVFNRWGESVFEVYNSQPNDPRWGWDGSYRGEPVNAAVYVWFAEIEFKNGDVEIIKGDVVIMR